MPLSSFAERVSQEKALRVASHFCSGSLATKSGVSLQLVAGGDAYYVFQRSGGGFVIVSGDDAAIPILAYSPTGKFETDIPANCKAWLEGYEAQIRYIRNSGTGRTPQAEALWNELLVATKAGGESSYEPQLLLTTANWDQGSPYNELCPVIDSTLCLTGCVATAAAIVAKYYQFPRSCSGTIPGYGFEYEGKHYDVPAHEVTPEYDWDYMPMVTNSISTDREKMAIAELMYDMGTIAQSAHGLDGTSAYTYKLVDGMIIYLGYDSHAQYLFRANYSDSVWVDMLKRDLNETGPIMYAGNSDDGGHQFLLTGYDNKDLFYINWGWGGTGNGYYALDAFTYGSHKYLYNHDAVFGMKPTGYDPEEGDLEDVSTVDYDPSTRTVTIETFRDASYTFTNSSGQAVTRGVSKEGRKIIIRSDSYKVDTYILTLIRGSQTKVLELMLGR